MKQSQLPDVNLAGGLSRQYIGMHYPQYLGPNRDQLISACADYLVGKIRINHNQAMRVALRELADYEALLSRSWLDIDRSTSTLVVIQDNRAGQRHYYTVEDLLRSATALLVKPLTS